MVPRAQRRPGPLLGIALCAALFAAAAAGCGAEAANGSAPSITFNTPTVVPVATTVPGPTGEATRESIVSGRTSEADDQPASLALACDDRESSRRALAMEVEAAMDGYDGEWGFALIDLACDATVAVNEDYFEYPASSAKVVTAVAALEAAESGELEEREVEWLDLSLRQVFRTSSDWDADLLEGYFDTSRLNELLAEAGVSERSYIRESWKFSMMTPLDLATFWAAILRGDLLEEDSTDYLLDLASGAEIPPEYETFPGGDFELGGFQYGQKAGYYVEDGVPYYLVGAGYLREIDGEEAFAIAFMMRTENPELLDPQRRSVFPLVVEHVLTVTGRG
jgi:hypothetical protein